MLGQADKLFCLSVRPDFSVASYSVCIVNGVKYLSIDHDSRRITQNSGVSIIGSNDGTLPDYFGVLEQVLELTYVKQAYHVLLLKCKWFDTSPRRNNTVYEEHFTTLRTDKEWYKDEPFIFASQARQVFYTNDPLKAANGIPCKIIHIFSHRHL